MNTDIDTETLLSASYDYPEISDDYNSIMNGVISGSTSSGAKKIMLMAMSYKPKGNIDNANVLFKYYYVTPAYFRFNKQDIEIGDQLTRVLFIKEYSTYVDDEMINDLTDNSEKNNGQQAYQQNKQSGRNGNAPQENICSGADYSEAYGAEP